MTVRKLPSSRWNVCLLWLVSDVRLSRRTPRFAAVPPIDTSDVDSSTVQHHHHRWSTFHIPLPKEWRNLHYTNPMYTVSQTVQLQAGFFIFRKQVSYSGLCLLTDAFHGWWYDTTFISTPVYHMNLGSQFLLRPRPPSVLEHNIYGQVASFFIRRSCLPTTSVEARKQKPMTVTTETHPLTSFFLHPHWTPNRRRVAPLLLAIWCQESSLSQYVTS